MHDSKSENRRTISPSPPQSSRAARAESGDGPQVSAPRISPQRYQNAPTAVVTGAIESQPMAEEASRCGAAHAEDVRECEGQRDAVWIIDRAGARVEGCLLHAAALLASLADGRVVPFNGPNGSAIEVFRRAQTVPAFAFLYGQRMATAEVAAEATPIPPTSGASTHEEDQGRLRWSWPGNARSSCLIETTESGPRGSAS